MAIGVRGGERRAWGWRRSTFNTSVKSVAAQIHLHTVPGGGEQIGSSACLARRGGRARDPAGAERPEFPGPGVDRVTLARCLALQAARGPGAQGTMGRRPVKMVQVGRGRVSSGNPGPPTRGGEPTQIPRPAARRREECSGCNPRAHCDQDGCRWMLGCGVRW